MELFAYGSDVHNDPFYLYKDTERKRTQKGKRGLQRGRCGSGRLRKFDEKGTGLPCSVKEIVSCHPRADEIARTK